MIAFFKDLFQYNRQRNSEMIEMCVQHTEQVSENTIKLMSHNLNAHHLWNHRILGDDGRYGPWDLHLINSWNSIDEQNFNSSIEIIDSGRLEENLHFKDRAGNPYENIVKDILFHVINHTNYHRAQMVLFLKSAGLEPGKTDFIYYKR